MSEQGKSEAKILDLDRELDNQEAINLIMELYGVDEQVASKLWGRFIETVKKMRIQAANQTQANE